MIRRCRALVSPTLGLVIAMAAALGVAVSTPHAAALVTSSAGLDVNLYLGADTFYNAGYTGANAVVANIEGGHAWNLHETLTGVTTFLHSPIATGPQLGDFDVHPTETAHIIAGQGVNNYQRGISPDAELWSGAIATEYPGAPTSANFNFSRASLRYPYETAMLDGVNGRLADVVNSSWGSSNSPDTTAHQYATAMIDALAYDAGTIVTVAAGNGGSAANSILPPATGYNLITVGAVANDQTNPPYNNVASFSSRGPIDFRNSQSGQVLTGVRAGVDLVAPGTVLKLAKYGGTTGSNTGGTDSTGGATDFYHNYQSGTSFAAPIVAGGAALIVDVGYDLYGGGASIDGRVVKSVLMNSADKTNGWNNGQSLVGGVITTTQSLDYNAGAGRMNLETAFAQYTAGTTDVPGLGGGNVEAIGWDYGRATDSATNDYYITENLIGGTTFNVTLTWFVDAYYSELSMSSFFHSRFVDLNLQVWSVEGGLPDTLVAESVSVYNNTEHLSFALPQTGAYMLRVLWGGEIYDLFHDKNNEELFGLAWAGVAVPLLGDLNGDGLVNTQDINPFVLALTNPAGFAAAFPDVYMVLAGDMNGDGQVNTEDINGFIGVLTGSAQGQAMSAFAAIPEPSSTVLMVMAVVTLAARRGRRKAA